MEISYKRKSVSFYVRCHNLLLVVFKDDIQRWKIKLKIKIKKDDIYTYAYDCVFKKRYNQRKSIRRCNRWQATYKNWLVSKDVDKYTVNVHAYSLKDLHVDIK